MADTEPGGLLSEPTPEEKHFFETEGGEKAPPGPEDEPQEPREPDEPPPDLEPDQASDRRGPSVGALHEEREKRRKMEARLEEESQRRARVEGRLDELVRHLSTPPEGRQPPPTIDDDPVGAVKQLYQHAQQRAQVEQHHAAKTQFETHVAQLESQFMRENPDYAEAAAFLSQRRSADLEAMGIADPQQRRDVLWNEAAGMAANAMRANRNPAEVAYKLAQSWGWKPKGQGQRQPADAESRIDMARAGSEASRSLSSSGGTPPRALSADAVARMSDEEFAQLKDSQWRKIWGA